MSYPVTVANNAAYANTNAMLTWSSLPESFTTWGGSAVGADGTATGERIGSGSGAQHLRASAKARAWALINGTLWDDTGIRRPPAPRRTARSWPARPSR